MGENVVVLGASRKPDRYSYQAVALLLEKGHTVIPIHPRDPEVCGIRMRPTLAEVTEPVDTVTLYVNPKVSSIQTEAIIGLKPRRVIFNPGTENPELETRCAQTGIATVTGCTLVMLKTGQF